MSLSKFLMLDISLIIIGLALIKTLQPNKEKNTLSDSLIQAPINFPAKEKLIELERIARSEGSGITYDSLIGIWKFAAVWKQPNDKEDALSSFLLRLFSASLVIKKDQSNEFAITNSIQFGLLSIRFIGAGNLKGKQPLLPFFFKTIELKLGSNSLFSRSLEKPKDKNMPFFALISIEDNGKWLSARGRGGGLALWEKD